MSEEEGRRNLLRRHLLWVLVALGGAAAFGAELSSDHHHRATLAALAVAAALIIMLRREARGFSAALRASEQTYFNLLERATDGIMVVQDDAIRLVNRQLGVITGYSSEELLDQPVDFIIVPESKALVRERYRRRMAGEDEPGRYEIELARKDGEGVWVEVNASIVTHKGRPADLVIMRDVSDRRRAEEEIRRLSEFRQIVIDYADIWINVIDVEGNIVVWNKAAERISGYSRDEVIGHTGIWEYLYPDPDYRAAIFKKAADIFTTRYPVGGFETTITAKGGGQHTLSWDSGVLTAPDGNVIGTVALAHDVTDSKQVLADLEQAKDQAEAASRAKSEFLASMSHEIRTPMNAILAMADLLADTPLDEMQARYVRVAKNAGEALLEIINDTIDLSRVEAGRLELRPELFDLRALLEDVVEMFALRARERGLFISCDVASELPQWWSGDAGRLRQVLLNLVGNAIKFTEAGGVALEVVQSPQGSGQLLQFTIRDTGIGVPAAKLDSIFESFTQGDASITRRHGGAGLGLAIVRRLVDLMGGQVSVESEPGRGSSFRFTVALTPRDGPLVVALPSSADIKIRPLSVLLVEDSELNAFVVRSFLKETPHHVDYAENGKVAVERFAGGHYDLVLMDLEMPVMDGYTATKEMRAIEAKRGGPTAAIVALTAHALSEYEERSRAAGFDDYLTKPVGKAQLRDYVTALAAERTQQALSR